MDFKHNGTGRTAASTVPSAGAADTPPSTAPSDGDDDSSSDGHEHGGHGH